MANRDTLSIDQKDGEKAFRANGKNYLLAIAIDAYKNCTQLNNAVNDAEAFIALVTSRYNVEKDHVTFIKDEQATKRSIDLAFLRLIKLITPRDNLIVYFSGHGRYDEHYGGNWVPVEAGIHEDDWPDYLSNDQVKNYLSRIKSLHTFLIADSCFSGALFAERGREKVLGNRVDTEPSRWALTSGKREIVSDGPVGGHSPFASALLDVLRKATEPPTVMQICTLVLEKVAANALQTPMGSALAVPGHQGGQLVLYFREDEDQAWTTAQAAHSIQAYTDFYDKYPDGNYTEQALDKLEELEEKAAWDKVPKNRQALLLRYLRENPRSPYVKEAQGLLDVLRGGGVAMPIEEQQEVERVERKHAEILYLSPIEEQQEVKPVLQPQAPPAVIVPEFMVHKYLILIKGGTFKMGDITTHSVTLNDYFMAKHPLTFGEYDTFCQATGRDLITDMGWSRENRPVINVNWFDALEYCNWRSEMEKLKQVYTLSKEVVTVDWSANGYRLPTEAEWEYAAKGGVHSQDFIYAGSNNIDEVAWYSANSNGKTQPVGQKKANELGLYDLSGNVWEWCWDWYDEAYYSNSPMVNPRGPNTGSARVVRGGSWDYGASYGRVTVRLRDNPDSRNRYTGFRVLRR